MSAISEPITLGYWAIRGLAAPLRMMCMHSGVPTDMKVYKVTPMEDGGWEKSSWFDEKKSLIKENPLMNLPFVQVNGVTITQSNACLQFLGKKLGYMGSNDIEEAMINQLLCEIMDLRNSVVRNAYNPSAPLDWLDSLAGSLTKLENWLAGNYGKATATECTVGSKVSTADFHLWELLDQVRIYSTQMKIANPIETNYPKLFAFWKAFKELPQNQKYLNSPLANLPCNNVMAKWGSAPEPVCEYDRATEVTWADCGGLY